MNMLILLASTFLMGSSFVAGKVLLQEGFAAILLVGWRFLAAALATLPLLWLEERNPRRALFPPGLGVGGAALVALIGLLQTAAVMGLLFLAMRTISASTAAILLFTNPLWVALLGAVFLGETVTVRRMIGLVFGLVGVGFALGVGPELFSDSSAATGELIGLGSSFCWAAATLVTKRARLPIKAWGLSFWQMLIGSLALLGLAYGMGQHWPADVSGRQWGWFVWLAIPASTGSFGLWFMALHRNGAAKASGFLFLAPLFTVILSYVVLGAPLSWRQAAGGALIGAALWLINRQAPPSR
jgi:drug/metabolite transporter (DMT)-like permease